MEFGNKLKSLRMQKGLSQEELAEAVYVTRQTISNWENSKSYPDIKSLLILSNFFSVSVDYLVKGDIKKMKDINPRDIKSLGRLSCVLGIMMIVLLITPIPLAKYLGWWGMTAYLLICVITGVVAILVEKRKRINNISTFKEIDAFMSGKQLDEIDSLKEEAKRPYQRILAAITCAAIALAVTALMFWLFM